MKALACIIHESGTWRSFLGSTRRRCDKGENWLEGKTDSKVLSSVHSQILTRSETLRVRA